MRSDRERGVGGPRSLRLWFALTICTCALTTLMHHWKISEMFPSPPDIIMEAGNEIVLVETGKIVPSMTDPTPHRRPGIVTEAGNELIVETIKKNASWTDPPQPRRLDDLLSKYNLSYFRKQPEYGKVKIPDANRTIAFLHIGKTGGSTISMHIRKGCQRFNTRPCNSRTDGWILNETAASHRIQNYYHLQDIVPPDALLDHRHSYTTIFAAVRNPISRFLSAFAYGHPTNSHATKINPSTEERQKYTCFPGISYLIKAAVGNAVIPWNKSRMQRIRDDKNSACFSQDCRRRRREREKKRGSGRHYLINCTELAEIAFGKNESWAVVNGSHPWMNHMTFDYRQYYRSMSPAKELLVLRHEHLWDDWVRVNQILSREHDTTRVWPDVPPFGDIQRNYSSKYHMKPRWEVQTDQEQSWLCQLLHEEIRVYLMILMRAVNLSEDDLLEAVSDVEKTCTEPVFSELIIMQSAFA